MVLGFFFLNWVSSIPGKWGSGFRPKITRYQISLEKHHPFLTRRLNQTPVYRRIGESHIISDIAGADEVFFAGLNSISLQLMLGFETTCRRFLDFAPGLRGDEPFARTATSNSWAGGLGGLPDRKGS